MRLLQKHYHGFTLIELLVTTAIAAIVVGGGIAGFIGFTDRQEVLNTAKEVQQLMRTAQSKARVRDVPNTCSTNPLQAYEVTVSEDSASMVAICPGAAPTPVIYNYPNGVKKNPIDQSVIRFATLEGGVTDNNTPPVAIPSSILYTFRKGTNTFSFIVSPIGSISNVQ